MVVDPTLGLLEGATGRVGETVGLVEGRTVGEREGRKLGCNVGKKVGGNVGRGVFVDG